MKILFKNKTKYSKETYTKFLKFHDEKYGLSYTFFTIFILLTILYCVIFNFSNKQWITGSVFILSFIIFILYRFLKPIYLVKKELKSKPITEEKTYIFKFYDKTFKIYNDFNYDLIPYWKLKKIFETNDFFYLYVDKIHAFLINKKTFTYGTPEDFSKFLKKKCWFKFKIVNLKKNKVST